MTNTQLNSNVNCGQSEEINIVTSSSSIVQSQILNTKVDELPKPPMWLRYYIHWFRIGLSIFLLMSILIGLGGCSTNTATINWNRATNIVPFPILEQVISENTRLNFKTVRENMLAGSLEGKEGKLVIFDFNTSDVCGALGCLYTGYWLRENQPIVQVFLNYLNPHLPPNSLLFEKGENRHQLPCIQVMQTEQSQLRRLNFCFNGNNYQLADNQLLVINEQKK